MASAIGMQAATQSKMTFEDKVKKFLGDYLILTLQLLWSGYVLSILWSWFMAPIFGLPSLRLFEALGVVLVLQWVRMPSTTNPSQKMSTIRPDGQKFEVEFTAVPLSFWWRTAYSFVTPLFVLAIGYIYRLFM